MRIVLDANVLVSYLLSQARDSLVTRIVRAILAGVCVLVLPDGLFAELSRSVARRAHLADKIHPDELRSLYERLSVLGELITIDPDAVAVTVRDAKDDYILVSALVGRADYLVTGDRDLLVLIQVGQVRIVTPREFWDILAQQPDASSTVN
jgi:putative PIN family toxin of toxin-antitoxin system